MSKASQNYARLHAKSIKKGCRVQDGNAFGEVIDLTSFGYAWVRFDNWGICSLCPVSRLKLEKTL